VVAWRWWSSHEIAASRTAIAAMGIENSRPGACDPTRSHRLRLSAYCRDTIARARPCHLSLVRNGRRRPISAAHANAFGKAKKLQGLD
jgi:hypothetical protein